MRMLLTAQIPTDVGNAAIIDGSLNDTIKSILEDTKPEAIYFCGLDGVRTALMIFDMQDPSELPKICEPWFLALEAECTVVPLMNLDDLEKAGPFLGAAVQKYGN